MSRKLLNAHSKYGGSCSILSYMRLEQHNPPSWYMLIELLTPYFEWALSRLEYAKSSSKRIQNKNDNFEWFWSLSIRTLQARQKLKRQLKKRFNIRHHMSTPRAFECYYFKMILNWWHSPFNIKCYFAIGSFEISESLESRRKKFFRRKLIQSYFLYILHSTEVFHRLVIFVHKSGSKNKNN
jgi:hypothetical protein